AVICSFTVGLTLVGVYLAGVKVYDEAELSAAREQPLVAFLLDLSYKRRLFEVCLDVVLIVLAYYFAYAMLFGPLCDSAVGELFLRTVPLLIGVKLAVFLGTGVYRGMWRYVGVHDLYVYARAVALSSIASVLLLLFLYRFEGFSRVVFILDAVLLLLLL